MTTPVLTRKNRRVLSMIIRYTFDPPAYGEECGVLSYVGKSLTVTPIPNHSDTPEKTFGILPADYYSVPGKPFGLVHTHPSRFPSRPSQDDIDGIPEGIIGAVYSLKNFRVYWYTNNGILMVT